MMPSLFVSPVSPSRIYSMSAARFFASVLRLSGSARHRGSSSRCTPYCPPLDLKGGWFLVVQAISGECPADPAGVDLQSQVTNIMEVRTE